MQFLLMMSGVQGVRLKGITPPSAHCCGGGLAPSPLWDHFQEDLQVELRKSLQLPSLRTLHLIRAHLQYRVNRPGSIAIFAENMAILSADKFKFSLVRAPT